MLERSKATVFIPEKNLGRHDSLSLLCIHPLSLPPADGRAFRASARKLVTEYLAQEVGVHSTWRSRYVKSEGGMVTTFQANGPISNRTLVMLRLNELLQQL